MEITNKKGLKKQLENLLKVNRGKFIKVFQIGHFFLIVLKSQNEDDVQFDADQLLHITAMSNSAISATVSRFNLGEEPLANQIKYFPLPTYIPLCSAVIYLSRIGLQPDLLL